MTRQRTSRPSRPAPAAAGAADAPAWWRGFLIALFVAALAWRALALARLAGGPLLTLLTADADVYWRWAGEIRAGHLVPDKPFFLAPLYPYWLALVRLVVGDSIVRVLVVQAILGSTAVVLLADATRRLSSPRAAALVGVALAGYAMAVAFDLLVLGENLLYFLGSLALWLVARGGRGRPLLLGAIVGTMALGRPTFLLLLAPLAMHLLAPPDARRLRTLAALLAVPAALLALTSLHQWRMDGSWTPVTYSGGFNLYVGNGPLANGTYVPVAIAYAPARPPEHDGPGGTLGDGRDYLQLQLGRRLSWSESSRYWTDATLEQVRAHPGRAARLLLRKVGLLFNRRESSQLIDTGVYDRAAGHLGWPRQWEFAFFGIGGLLGFAFAWRRGGLARLVAVWLAALAAGLAVFFVVDRYRLHLIPPLALLTGVGLEQVAAAWRARRRRDLGAAAAVAGGAALLVFAPLIPRDPARVEWEHEVSMANAWLARGEAARALELYARAIALDRAGPMPGAGTQAGRIARAAMYENAGIAFGLQGDDLRALDCLEEAVALAPESRSTRARWADALARSGHVGMARAEYDSAGVKPADAAEGLVREAVESEQRGDHEGTLRRLAAAAGLAPGYEPAVVPLVRLLIQQGALGPAEARLNDAAAQGLDANLVRAHRAWILAARGDADGARRLLDQIPPAVREGDPRVAATIDLLQRATTFGRTPQQGR